MGRCCNRKREALPPTSMTWTNEALGALKRVPAALREAVVRSVEDYARENGHPAVTAEVVARARAEREGPAKAAMAAGAGNGKAAAE